MWQKIRDSIGRLSCLLMYSILFAFIDLVQSVTPVHHVSALSALSCTCVSMVLWPKTWDTNCIAMCCIRNKLSDWGHKKLGLKLMLWIARQWHHWAHEALDHGTIFIITLTDLRIQCTDYCTCLCAQPFIIPSLSSVSLSNNYISAFRRSAFVTCCIELALLSPLWLPPQAILSLHGRLFVLSYACSADTSIVLLCPHTAILVHAVYQLCSCCLGTISYVLHSEHFGFTWVPCKLMASLQRLPLRRALIPDQSIDIRHFALYLSWAWAP